MTAISCLSGGYVIFEGNEGSQAKASGWGAGREFPYVEYLAVNYVTYKLRPADVT